jgi:hypothetical protein
MATAQEYRKFAEECLRWADEAETEEFKDAFIQMARDWTLAAMRLEAPPPRESGDQAARRRSRDAALIGGGPVLEKAGVWIGCCFDGYLSADCQRQLWAVRN